MSALKSGGVGQAGGGPTSGVSGWAAGEFAARIIGWHRCHGRHGLPWQGTREPYRVWLSEIMLQQTQVVTVLDYYPRLLRRFPDVSALAATSEDEVLALWSGLGYYSRARQLHRCARQVVDHHGGAFPGTAGELARLPGIGRSTAAAIAAFCFGERVPILDGNVRRVLARVFAIRDDLSKRGALDALWQRAETLLPVARPGSTMPAYTQGLMDLGATVCRARQPDCAHCPLADRCLALALGEPERYPVPRARPERRHAALWLVHAHDGQGGVWLVRRPSRGIWARLHCLPAHETLAAALASVPAGARVVSHPVVGHTLTHRELALHMLSVQLDPGVQFDRDGRWFAADEWPTPGLPAPVRRFLVQMAQTRAVAATVSPRPVRDAA